MCEKSPQFSVIVPVFNSEQTLSRCLDSILNQTFKQFELIIVNDGSTDNSGAICNLYSKKDTRVRVYHKANGGASSARNMGLKVAHGDWVTFCDSDDYVEPSWLDNYATHRDEVDLIITGFQAIEKTPRLLRETVFFDGVLPAAAAFDNMILNKVIGYTPTKAFRMDIIRQNDILFDESRWLKEDELFVLSYFRHVNSVSFSSSTAYVYFVPEWQEKYHKEEALSLELLLLELKIIKTYSFLHRTNEGYVSLLTRTANTLFDMYNTHAHVGYRQLNRFKSEVGRDFYLINGISIFSKISYACPTTICNLLFKLKSFIRQ